MIKFLLKSRGIMNIISRAISIFKRFSLTEQGAYILYSYAYFVNKLGIKLTLPITAILLKRYIKIIKNLQKIGVKFAIHGYIHKDYSLMDFDNQYSHFIKAIKIFKNKGINFLGFRAPYNRYNEATIKAVTKLGFLWDSSKSFMFTIDEIKDLSMYKKVLNLYNPIKYNVPQTEYSVVEIPSSLPDDEMLIDRFKFSPQKVESIWLKMLKNSNERGDLLVLQLHPERFILLKNVIKKVISEAKKLNIWIASLDEIANWWQLRKIKIEEIENKHYKVECNENASLFLHNVSTKSGIGRFIRQIINKNIIEIKSEIKPVIYIYNCSERFVKFLKNEGFLVEERNKNPYFKDINEFDEYEILSKIENSDFPIVRVWRWPNGYKSALSLTGDIDAITIFDFFYRFVGK